MVKEQTCVTPSPNVIRGYLIPEVLDSQKYFNSVRPQNENRAHKPKHLMQRTGITAASH
jgi:hypothetical protein